MRTVSDNDYDLYVINKANGEYAEPENLGDNINSNHTELFVYIDPDEDYIIFTSDRPGGLGESDLYISYKKQDGTWTVSQNMSKTVNSASNEFGPYVSPDGNYLFFLTDRENNSRNIFWLDTSIIETLKPDGLK